MTMLSEAESTLGQRIRAEMKRKKMSMRELSRRLDVAQPSIFKWVHDQSEPSMKYVMRMAEVFDVSLLWLIYGTVPAAQNTVETPAAAMIISEEGLKYVDSPDCLYYPVKSDEMAPTLEAGDTAIVDRHVKTFDQAGIYLVRIAGESLLRRFRRALDGSIRVSCDNSAKYSEVETLEAGSGVEIVGRVVSKVSVERVN